MCVCVCVCVCVRVCDSPRWRCKYAFEEVDVSILSDVPDDDRKPGLITVKAVTITNACVAGAAKSEPTDVDGMLCACAQSN